MTPDSAEERRRTAVGIRAPAGRQVLTTPGAPAARPPGEGLGRPPDLRQLVEDEPAERETRGTRSGGDERAGTLVVGGFVVGPVVGLILGLRDRAAVSAAAPPPPTGGPAPPR